MQKAHLIHHRANVRKQLADHLAALAVGLKFPGRTFERFLAFVQLFAVVLLQLGLVIKGIDMRQTAGEKEQYQMLGAGGVMSRLRCQRMTAIQRGSVQSNYCEIPILQRQSGPWSVEKNRVGSKCFGFIMKRVFT